MFWRTRGFFWGRILGECSLAKCPVEHTHNHTKKERNTHIHTHTHVEQLETVHPCNSVHLPLLHRTTEWKTCFPWITSVQYLWVHFVLIYFCVLCKRLSSCESTGFFPVLKDQVSQCVLGWAEKKERKWNWNRERKGTITGTAGPLCQRLWWLSLHAFPVTQPPCLLSWVLSSSFCMFFHLPLTLHSKCYYYIIRGKIRGWDFWFKGGPHLVYSQLCLLRGPFDSVQHRKLYDYPCCSRGVMVPYAISLFSLRSLSSLSPCSENKIIKSTLQIWKPSGKPICGIEWRKTIEFHSSVLPGWHADTWTSWRTHVQVHAHGNAPAFTHTRARTHTHTRWVFVYSSEQLLC